MPTIRIRTRKLTDAHWRGNVYSRKIVDGYTGRRLVVVKISGSNPHATCSQVARRSIPRHWRQSKTDGRCTVIQCGIIYPPGSGAPIFEHDGHAISIPLERIIK